MNHNHKVFIFLFFSSTHLLLVILLLLLLLLFFLLFLGRIGLGDVGVQVELVAGGFVPMVSPGTVLKWEKSC